MLMDRRYIESLHLNEIGEDSYIKDLPVIKNLMQSNSLNLNCDVVFFGG